MTCWEVMSLCGLNACVDTVTLIAVVWLSVLMMCLRYVFVSCAWMMRLVDYALGSYGFGRVVLMLCMNDVFGDVSEQCVCVIRESRVV